MNKTTIIVLLSALLLTGCLGSIRPKVAPIVIEQRVASIPVFHPPLPDKISLRDFKWTVLTPKLMQEYLTDLEAGNAPIVIWYGITPDGYKSLAENIAILRRYIKEQQAIILYYRDNLKKTVPTEETKQP